MTTDERGQILVTARLLEAAGKLDWLSTGLTLLAAAQLVFGAPSVFDLVVIVLGIMAKTCSILIAFDAKLLRDVALETITAVDLDAAFPAKARRDWPTRLSGAQRLVTIFAVTTVAQCVGIVVIGIAR